LPWKIAVLQIKVTESMLGRVHYVVC